MKTIPEIATDIGCKPQTVHKAKKRAETATGQAIEPIQDPQDKRKFRYTSDQIELLKSYINLDEVEKRNGNVDEPVDEPVYESVATVTVDSGNHTAIATVSQTPSHYSLEQFRLEDLRLTFPNPEAVTQSITTVLEGLRAGMSSYEKQQKEELDRIREAKKQAEAEIKRFEVETQNFKLKAFVRAEMQNAEIAEFQTLAEQIAAMGKQTQTNTGDR